MNDIIRLEIQEITRVCRFVRRLSARSGPDPNLRRRWNAQSQRLPGILASAQSARPHADILLQVRDLKGAMLDILRDMETHLALPRWRSRSFQE